MPTHYSFTIDYYYPFFNWPLLLIYIYVLNSLYILLLQWILQKISFLSSPVSNRTHANGSIKRGNKDNATDMVYLRTGIGVQLKDIKVFNRARQQGVYPPEKHSK